MTTVRSSVLLAPNEGKTLSVHGNRLVFKTVSRETDGGLLIIEYNVVPQFGGPPPHIHARTDEAFYVLEGSLTLRVDDRMLHAEAGGFAFVPRGSAHAFANEAMTPARFLVVMTPAGFESYFEEMAELLQRGGQYDLATITALSQKYDQIPVELPALPA